MTVVAAAALRGGAPPDPGLLGSAWIMVLHPCSGPSQRPWLPTKAEVGKPKSERGMAPVHYHKRGVDRVFIDHPLFLEKVDGCYFSFIDLILIDMRNAYPISFSSNWSLLLNLNVKGMEEN